MTLLILGRHHAGLRMFRGTRYRSVINETKCRWVGRSRTRGGGRRWGRDGLHRLIAAVRTAAAEAGPPPSGEAPAGRKVWPGIFSFSAAYGSLKGCHELLLPSLLSAASTNSGESGGRVGRILCFAPHLCEPETLALDWSSVTIGEARSDDELLASVRLRVRSFYEFNQSYNIEGHKEYVVEREFEALKERVAGKKVGFRRASCINATLPLSKFSSRADDLCTACKFYDNEEQRVVIATLDLNQCRSLADELTGTRPEGTGNDLPRAYLSNVCVAQELQRNGLGNALVLRSRKVAEEWGITDLYVHVAVDNEAAKKLYEKTGFTYESEEPAWQARFLGRPRRFLLWSDLTRAK